MTQIKTKEKGEKYHGYMITREIAGFRATRLTGVSVFLSPIKSEIKDLIDGKRTLKN